ncbi:VOC family protein [Alicyclobacillus acidiphilus]|uniref:VOC family protein n=1 Tax=Alicyclobacillus acidiphilus TaxID=182455 RepID=UPI0008296D48|nr:VOC family protein [Alicyclobacillus acidiphilus]
MIAHIILNVKDFDVSERFYDEVLGGLGFTCNLREVEDGVSVKSYIRDGHNIWIRHDVGSRHHAFVRDVGLDHIALLADSKEKVDELYQAVSALDALVTQAPEFYPEYAEHYYAFYFRDPSGIPLEICTM